MNWDYLQNNITDINFDTTNLSDPYTITNTMIETADSTSEGYLGLGIMLGIFLVLTFVLFRDDEDIRLDILRSIMFSSGFVSIIGFIMLVSNIVSSYAHVMWFFTIFMLSALGTFLLKKKGF